MGGRGARAAAIPPPPARSPAVEEKAPRRSRAFQWEGEGVDVSSFQGNVEILSCLGFASPRKER